MAWIGVARLAPGFFRHLEPGIMRTGSSPSRVPRTVQIRSANNDFQHAEVLRRNRQKRQHFREFFLEGVRPINLALEHRWDIEAWYYAPDRGLSDWAKDILTARPARTHFELTSELLAALSGKSEPSELMAVVKMPE